ncbi:MFS transporter [archaeon]|nr:MAG: MFS transporter [archaeon]
MKHRSPLSSEKKSYLVIFMLYIVYGISYSLLIPALPALTLQITEGNSAKSSIIYGFASFIRYSLEFFSSPVLGTIADAKGRKPVLLLAYLISAFEFMLLAFFPSIAMIFITRAMSGLFDAGVATSYAIVTDTALFNNDTVSQQYALLGAMTGVAFIVGPYFGGILSQTNLTLCFCLASLTAFIGALACYFLLEETVQLRTPTHPLSCPVDTFPPLTTPQSLLASINPLNGLKVNLSNPKIRQYLFPLFLSTLNTGMSFLWYIYLHARYAASPVQIGTFLSFHGFMNAIMQGIVIQYIIPDCLDEKYASVLLMFSAALHSLGNALAADMTQLYLVTVVLGISIAQYPAFKAVIINDGLDTPEGLRNQANLQGTISSVRTLATALGALCYSSVTAWGMELHPVAYPQVGFVVSAIIYAMSWFYLRVLFAEQDEAARQEMEAAAYTPPSRSVLTDAELLLYDENRPLLQQHGRSPRSKSYETLATFHETRMHDETEFLT